ncbi:MAG: NUDIX hydrolase [Candidatus Woesearchaeota archaeon]
MADKEDNGKWKVLESEYLVQNKWVNVKREKIRLPNNKIIEDYYIIERPDSVIVFCLTKQNKILILKQYKHGAQEEIHEIPAGMIDDGETPEEAAKREVLEETGYKYEKIEKIGTIFLDPTATRSVCHIFFATGAEKVSEQKLDQTEDITVMEMTKEEVLENLKNSTLNSGIVPGAIFLGLEKMKDMEDESAK